MLMNELQQQNVNTSDKSIQFSINFQFGTNIQIDAYPIDKPLMRLVRAEESPFLQFPGALIEMSLHTPVATRGNYDVKRLWVMLPNGESGNGEFNNTTAVQLYAALVHPESPDNQACVTGAIPIQLEVPNYSWDHNTDAGKSLSQLREEDKVVMSDVLLVNASGLKPNLSYDHTKVINNDFLDYEKVRENFKGNYKPLAPHPTLNHFGGYATMRLDSEMNEFHKKSGIQSGVGKTNLPKGNSKDYSRNRFYFTGHVFRDTSENHAIMPMAFTLDDSRHLDNDREGSFALGFHGRLIPGVDNEFNFDGVLRIQEFQHTTATAFRISISRYLIMEVGANKHSQGKDITDGINSLDDLQFNNIDSTENLDDPIEGLTNSLNNTDSEDDIPFDIKADSKVK